MSEEIGKNPSSQKTILSRFMDSCVEFDLEYFAYAVPTHELYRHFCKYAGIELDENDKPITHTEWSLTGFTKAIISDYIYIRVKRLTRNGHQMQCYVGLRLKEH